MARKVDAFAWSEVDGLAGERSHLKHDDAGKLMVISNLICKYCQCFV